ncbi:MAG: enoyl-CoA hydratase-related protein [Magnetovibrionaceae bacterium]
MKTLLIEREGSIARVILNRPDKHNCFDEALIRDLTKTFDKLAKDDGVRVIKLESIGKSFSAGGDIDMMRRMGALSEKENLKDARKLAGVMSAIYQNPKPVMALVQGPAIGGGVGLAACCDIVLASERAFFQLSEVRLGLVPGVISPYVIRAIGARQARRYFLTAERISAARALELGLVHDVVAETELNAKAAEIAAELLKGAPGAVSEAKSLVHYAAQPLTREILEGSARAIAKARSSAEGQEGVKAFLDKRPAAWIGGES